VKRVAGKIWEGLVWFFWVWTNWGTPITAGYQKKLAPEDVVEIFHRHFAGKYVAYRPPLMSEPSAMFFTYSPLLTMDFVIKKSGWMGVRVLYDRDEEAGKIRFGLHHYISFAQERIISVLLVIPRFTRDFLQRLPSVSNVSLPENLLLRVLLYLPRLLLLLPWLLMLPALGLFCLLMGLFSPLFYFLVALEMLRFVISPSFDAMREEVKSFIENAPEFKQIAQTGESSAN